MRAFQITKASEPPELVQVSTADLGPNDVRLNIKACALNFADLLMIKGAYQETPHPPFTLGLEFAGEIDATGAAVTHLQKGNRVVVYGGQGGLADQAMCPAANVLPIPDAMSFEDAAAFQIAYGTSHVALEYKARLQPGETLVVLGAAGGVGLTAVELGKLMGARVVAVARGADKLQVAKQAGADHVLDAETPDLRRALKDLGGADVVYDAVGGDAFRAAFRACKPEARLLAIGHASGDVPQIPANHLLVKNISVIGFYWGGYLKFKPQVIADSLTRLMTWYEAGQIKPHISHKFTLDQAAEALDILRARKSTGKIVITP